MKQKVLKKLISRYVKMMFYLVFFCQLSSCLLNRQKMYIQIDTGKIAVTGNQFFIEKFSINVGDSIVMYLACKENTIGDSAINFYDLPRERYHYKCNISKDSLLNLKNIGVTMLVQDKKLNGNRLEFYDKIERPNFSKELSLYNMGK